MEQTVRVSQAEAQERHHRWWVLERARRRSIEAYRLRADRTRYGLPPLPPTSEEQQQMDALERSAWQAWQDFQQALTQLGNFNDAVPMTSRSEPTGRNRPLFASEVQGVATDQNHDESYVERDDAGGTT